ncbi:rRNA accumulation- protein [Tilletia horrida]|uniref:rRNA accumulation- protein n=1 Tax=Tilletia horrida TaxID=155126 RepID=A0AAN6GTH8_9BASI|nr:rRNA accumulation- protein [Tilletia horrida]KAK0556449.1 rRNA accumulation- protein [Tilletia horrida]KAK0569379.1 rRNA accumulation- protein [Tilletia horrida]
MASSSAPIPSTSASGQAAAQASAPAHSSIQFARGILLRFSIWPTLKTAVAEQWGGPDSQDKRDFLVGHLVDEYGMPAPAPTPSAAAAAAASSSSGATAVVPAPLDMDDLADVIQDYVEQEYECLIEDDSVPRVAQDIVALHRAIFITAAEDGGASAQQLLQQLEQASSQLRGVQVQVERQSDGQDDEDEDDDDQDSESGEGEDGDVEMQEDQASTSRPSRQEPEVDEDGFTTVQSGRRRRH